MHCYKCGSVNYIKSGIIRNKQRYKCKDCNYKFTNTHGRGYPPRMRAEAMQLYSENMGIRSIARYFKISPSTVLLWIRKVGNRCIQSTQEEIPKSISNTDVIEIDEMWHFTKKKRENCESGSRYPEKQDPS